MDTPHGRPWPTPAEKGLQGTSVLAFVPFRAMELRLSSPDCQIKDFLNQDNRGLDYLEQFTLEKAEGEPNA